MKKVRHYLEFFLVLLSSRLLNLIPDASIKPFASFLSKVWYALDNKRKAVARKNILKAMPETYNEENVDELVRKVYFNTTLTFLEVNILFNNGWPWLREKIEVIGEENIQEALKKNKGILFFTGHYGNWELNSIKVSLEILRTSSVYRALDNPFLDRMLLNVREGFQQTMIAKQGAVRKLLRALKNKEAVGLLIDQHVTPYGEGIWSRFFNRPAATSPIIAQLHERSGAPVIPVFCRRIEGGKFQIIIQEELQMDDGENAIEMNTQKINDALEAEIRKHPEFWLWIHKRWKTSPDE